MSNRIRITAGDDFMQPDSDIVIKIGFVDTGSAARVFDIAAGLIRSFEDLDRTLISTIDTKITTELILEDIEKSSLKIFLRNVLQATDDQALQDLNWKKQVGTYLLKSKHVALEWLDRKIDDDEPAGIEDLTENIRKLAQETDVRRLPDYPPLNPSRVAQPLDQIQRIKGRFKEGEDLTITLDKTEYSVDLSSTWIPSEHMADSDVEQELSNESDMVLIIRKPDFLGNTQWQFRHGKKSYNAPIEDTEWLDEFHKGDHALKPGDALRVRMRFNHKYDTKGDLIESSEKIVKVIGVIHSLEPPKDLFDL